ncbi:MAG: DUF6351 family protein [Colwellia sp.]|nr:DUF6351 family protein [Colwellia sp.]
MSKMKMLLICFCLIAISCFYLFLWQPTTSYEFRQVKKIAPTQKNYLLKIESHIADASRPVETFDFPIAIGEQGPSTSLYSGSNQYPFYCMTLNADLGQPIVDNQQGYGVPVYKSIDKQQQIIGYSKDCNALSKLSYYRITGELNIEQVGLTELSEHSLDAAAVKLFRIEQGTINRFVYTMIMPISVDEVGDRLAKSQWNNRLIYQFNGGSGIGYRQGRQTAKRVMKRQISQLLNGYAVISSSGNRTSYTYNMLLAEDTARRVKKQFTSLYGQPLYTVGIGGSGGGLAQYLIGQNSTGILDGLIPLYSYPDMITQTSYALDCDLLNNYFTFRADNRSSWNDWNHRQLIEGMNALNDFPQRTAYLQPVNQLMAGFIPSLPQGNSECINGYFGLSSFINNPQQGFIRDFFHQSVVQQTKWSYWQDLKELLGVDEHGYGLSTWDNVGVQYGLKAFVENSITVEEFLDINKKIGGWKPQNKMEKEAILTPFGRKLPLWLSLWGNQNITEVENDIAARSQGSIIAMQQAYRWGQVFIGKVELPIIDVRHYLEQDLDMHHVSASFYSRLRLEQANGHSNNQIIWLSDKRYNPAEEAFKFMDKWLLALQNDSSGDVVAAKPVELKDSCFNDTGQVIANGVDVFNGEWNGQYDGKCQQVFPMFSTSRIQAGGTWAGDVLKCQLMSITKAFEKELYGKHDMNEYKTLLQKIFPQGVCDYTKGDVGRPRYL